MENKVATYRSAGLEARWGRTHNGAPAIFVRDPAASLPHQRETWWMVTKSMFDAMRQQGIRDGFSRATLLGDIFSI